MQRLNQNYIYKIVRRALEEDLSPSGDITTRLINNKKSKAKIIAEQSGVIAGLDFCKSAFNSGMAMDGSPMLTISQCTPANSKMAKESAMATANGSRV